MTRPDKVRRDARATTGRPTMTYRIMPLASIAALSLAAGGAHAEGALNIYNWGNYTSPEMIEKFEQQYDVDVTVTDYDSNDTALAKLKAGGHGFDIVVPSGNYVPIFIEEGVLMKSNPNEMENFGNVAERWVDVEFDPGREYTVPWQWGTVGVSVNTSVYDGDLNTAALIFDPPEELKGKINVLDTAGETLTLASLYLGIPQCTSDRDQLKALNKLVIDAKVSLNAYQAAFEADDPAGGAE